MAEAETSWETVTVIQAEDAGACSQVRRSRSLKAYLTGEPKAEKASS